MLKAFCAVISMVQQRTYDYQSLSVIVLSVLASPPFSIKENGRGKMGEGLAAPGGESPPPKTGRGTLIKRGGRRKFSSAHAINHRLRFALVTPTLIALIVGCWARRGIIWPQPDKDDGCSGFFFKKGGPAHKGRRKWADCGSDGWV